MEGILTLPEAALLCSPGVLIRLLLHLWEVGHEIIRSGSKELLPVHHSGTNCFILCLGFDGCFKVLSLLGLQD